MTVLLTSAFHNFTFPNAAVAAGDPAPTLVRIDVTPAAVLFDNPRGRQQLVVTGRDAAGNEYDLTRAAAFAWEEAAVAAIDSTGLLQPRATGQSKLTVRAGSLTATVPVEVTNLNRPAPVSFRNEVVPVLTKTGCNGGACHGKPNGKNGFALSLRGYAPELDYLHLSHETGARRVNMLNPSDSLILLKATATMAHEGGRRFQEASDEYAIVSAWVTEGLRDDPPGAARLEKIDVFPTARIIDAPATEQQLLVTAHFADGSRRDVTHLARYSASDELNVETLPGGLVRRRVAGEVAIVVEYLGQIVAGTLLFRDTAPGFVPQPVPQENYVDRHVIEKLNVLRIAPSVVSSDAEFVRRVYLDTIGVLPAPDELRAFLADASAGKRAQLIDRLLNRPEYADWWAMKWTDRLGCNNRFVGKIGAIKYHSWIRDCISANMPEDEMVRTILTASGGNYGNPPAGFFRRLRSPDLAVEEVSQLFLGVRLQCAKCHNHPGERWLQDDYYGMAAFFARMKFRDGPFFNHLYDKEETVREIRDGEVTNPRTGGVAAAKFLGGAAPSIAAGASRRQALADWLTARDNPFFARNAANRIWFHVMGRGIVHPVDDFKASNPPSNGPLLDGLAADFASHGFDRKHLLRTILNSRSYQFSSTTNPLNEQDEKYFSRGRVRLLGAEQLLDAIGTAAGEGEEFAGFPPDTGAIQLPDGEFQHEFLNHFGRPARALACECERESDSTLSQALALVGGDLVQRKIKSDTGRVSRLVAGNRSPGEIVEELFLATLSRFPTEPERAALLPRFAGASAEARRKFAEDILWALINHREFLFQH